MAESRYVKAAAEWARVLIHAETRGAGDIGNAIKRVAAKLKLSPKTIWGLRYRKPKDLLCSVYFPLRDAFYKHQKKLARRRDAVKALKALREEHFLGGEAFVRNQRAEA